LTEEHIKRVMHRNGALPPGGVSHSTQTSNPRQQRGQRQRVDRRRKPLVFLCSSRRTHFHQTGRQHARVPRSTPRVVNKRKQKNWRRGWDSDSLRLLIPCNLLILGPLQTLQTLRTPWARTVSGQIAYQRCRNDTRSNHRRPQPKIFRRPGSGRGRKHVVHPHPLARHRRRVFL